MGLIKSKKEGSTRFGMPQPVAQACNIGPCNCVVIVAEALLEETGPFLLAALLVVHCRFWQTFFLGRVRRPLALQLLVDAELW